MFIRGYTTKQWGRDPAELPASIIRRIPIRMTFDDRYFDDVYQGIPIDGYTRLFENLLDHPRIRVELDVDYFAHAGELRTAGTKVVYTGKIDEFFDYRFGRLEYRSLRFETEELAGDFQGAAIVNHCDAEIPFTRITEHKHFALQNSPRTVVTREYPLEYHQNAVPYYPIRNAANSALYERYRAEAARSQVIFGGRLGTYQYYDMHQVIAQAMMLASEELDPAVRRPAA
jgi:UDP-galactopyranose mutase